MSILLAVVLAATGTSTFGGGAKISASSTYYDRKEGYIYFNGKVHVADSKYDLHADRAYVYMDGTNALKRIVAVGHVALTNGTQRAYGATAKYYRNPGVVVLEAGDGVAAEVRDETPDGAQTVRGKKIRFWTNTRQVEVLDSEITVPSQGGAKGLGLGELGR